MRVVAKAILTHKDKAILAYYPKDDVISFFGGRIEEMEKSETALIRELEEELNLSKDDINSMDFTGVAENFFLYEGEKAHHMVVYYHVNLSDIESLKALEQDRHELIFVDIDKIKDVDIKPSIQSYVQEYIDNKSIFHVVVNDDNIAI